MANPTGSTGNGTANVAITGTLASINAILGGLTYQANRNYGGGDTLTVDVDDLGSTGGGSQTDDGTVGLSATPDLVQLQNSLSFPGKKDLLITGTAGNDVIGLTFTGTTKRDGEGQRRQSRQELRPTGNILVYGLDGNDTITVNGKIKKRAFIDGGDGNDTITGGGGADILLGGLGTDAIKGGRPQPAHRRRRRGRPDGGGGDDILIGGTTTHDDGRRRPRRHHGHLDRPSTFNTRVTNLAATLNAGTVPADLAADTLTGGLGSDWFWTFGAT